MNLIKETFETYQNNPALNTSALKQIVNNPYLYKIQGLQDFKSDSVLLGSAIHCRILEPEIFDSKFILLQKKFDLRKTQDKAEMAEIKAQAEAENKEILTLEQSETLINLCDSILKSEAWNYLKNDIAQDLNFEISAYGKINNFDIKARFDMFYISKTGKRVIVDLKTCLDSSVQGFGKQVTNLDYYLQAYIYKTLINADSFRFFAIETKEPFMCALYEADNQMLELGENLFNKAIQNFLKLDTFTSTRKDADGDILQVLSLPAYAFYKDL